MHIFSTGYRPLSANVQWVSTIAAARHLHRIPDHFTSRANTFKWTAGQCYQASHDFSCVASFLDIDGGKAKVSVDVYNADTNVRASSVDEKESVDAFGATQAFNMEAPVAGAYYYLITLFHGTNDEQCGPKRSFTFAVNANPHSPPAQC